MNGYDIQDYLLLEQKCKDHRFQIKSYGNKIDVRKSNDTLFYQFDTVKEALYFMIGFERGSGIEDKSSKELGRLLTFIPGVFPIDDKCFDRAIDWINKGIYTEHLFEAALSFLIGLNGYEDYDREKWLKFFENKIF